MSAWLFQDPKQVAKVGKQKCKWSVGWRDPNGKRKQKTIGAKSHAERFKRKIEGELQAGTYRSESRITWSEFRKEYEQTVSNSKSVQSRRCDANAMDHFERLVIPERLSFVTTATIDAYIAKRRNERGRRKGSRVSPSSINKELRHLKLVLRVANDWGYLPVVPKFRMIKEVKKLVRYVTPEHFASIYNACDVATKPDKLAYSPSDWWKALLTFIYMTGWRISEPLALRRSDLDLDERYAITRGEDNKAGRDEKIPLHPVVTDHLERIKTFSDLVFLWPHGQKTLYREFHAIQKRAEIHLHCVEQHEHTPECHLYGFHDLRRAFATTNAKRLAPSALQAMMRHKSFTTTQRYINMASLLDDAVESLHVPDVFRVG